MPAQWSTRHAPVDRDDEARDQHLFAGADAAGALRQRAGTALWRGGDRSPIAAPGPGSAPISTSRRAKGPRSCCRSPPSAPPSGPVEDAAYAEITDRICEAAAEGRFDGIMLDLHGAMVTESLEDGEGQFLKWLRAIVPQHADRGGARHARQPLRRDCRQRDGRHRLSHLPACRHLRDGASRRRNPVAGDAWRGPAGHGLGQCTDAAACHAPGHRRPPEQGAAAPLRRDERGGRVGGEPLHRLSACRHRQCRAFRRGRDRRRPRARRKAARRVAGPRLGRARGFCLPDRAIGRIDRARQGDAGAGAWRGPDRIARPLRQLRLGRDDGHDRGIGDDHAPRARRCRRLCDLRPTGGNAGDRRRHRRAGESCRSAARLRCRRSRSRARP